MSIIIITIEDNEDGEVYVTKNVQRDNAEEEMTNAESIADLMMSVVDQEDCSDVLLN